MKQFIFAITLALCTTVVQAANENAATSKEYVDTELATKQPTISAQGNNVVMTFDSTATNGIGTKNIYDPSGDYASQQDALVTAQTANAAVQMAINGEFECVLYDPDNPTDCWWWNIKRLPNGYTELPYIESTGTQWVQTNVTSTGNITIDANIFITNQSYIADSQFCCIAGAHAVSRYFGINVYNNSNYNNYTIGGHEGSVWTPNIWQHYKFTSGTEGGNLYVDGVLVADRSASAYSSSQPIGIFNMGDGLARSFAGRMRTVTILKDGSLVFNGVPAQRNSDGAVGFYDTISNTFLTNSGTGDFIAGTYLPNEQ